MRALVFSDTHGNIQNCHRAMERCGKVDYIIHLGDIYRDSISLEEYYPEIRMEYVIGNNDPYADGEKTKIIELEGHKILITHGHLFRHTMELAEYAKMRGAEVALFGHTHCASREKLLGIEVINFGSISRPRIGACSFGVIEIENGKMSIATIEI